MDTKASGEVEKFDGGGQRDKRDGKGRFDLISPHMLKRLADLYERGAKLYGDRNWEKGMPFSRLTDSAMRHLNQYRMGNREEDHLIAAIWNITAIIHFECEQRSELDDLPRYNLGG